MLCSAQATYTFAAILPPIKLPRDLSCWNTGLKVMDVTRRYLRQRALSFPLSDTFSPSSSPYPDWDLMARAEHQKVSLSAKWQPASFTHGKCWIERSNVVCQLSGSATAETWLGGSSTRGTSPLPVIPHGVVHCWVRMAARVFDGGEGFPPIQGLREGSHSPSWA